MVASFDERYSISLSLPPFDSGSRLVLANTKPDFFELRVW